MFASSLPEKIAAYAAPEVQSKREALVNSDIYSLALYFCEFLLGRNPAVFHEKKEYRVSLYNTAKMLMRRIVPRELIEIILKCLRYDSSQRFVNIIEFIARLNNFISERRFNVLKKIGIDPLYALEKLNLSTTRADASTVIRTLSSVDYFSAIASNEQIASSKQFITYPNVQFRDSNAIIEVEKKEITDWSMFEREQKLTEKEKFLSVACLEFSVMKQMQKSKNFSKTFQQTQKLTISHLQ